jgi:hypothetical protein
MSYSSDLIPFPIAPTQMLPITGTWTEAAGQVAGTLCKHKAAAAETTTVNIPMLVPAHIGSGVENTPKKGSAIKYIEVDYELLAAAATSVTATLKKIKRGTDTNVAVVSTIATTQDLAAAGAAATQDQHKLTITITDPQFIQNDEYYNLELVFVCGAAVTIDVLGAMVYTLLKI